MWPQQLDWPGCGVGQAGLTVHQLGPQCVVRQELWQLRYDVTHVFTGRTGWRGPRGGPVLRDWAGDRR